MLSVILRSFKFCTVTLNVIMLSAILLSIAALIIGQMIFLNQEQKTQ